MLVLAREVDESIIIGDNIVITVVDIRGGKVRLGIQAPREIPVYRQEVYDAIQSENAREAEEPKGNEPESLAGGTGPAKGSEEPLPFWKMGKGGGKPPKRNRFGS